MNITESAKKITSIVLAEYIEAGGELAALETLNRGEGDRELHIFTVADRDGAYISDNAGVSWFDASFDRVVEALRSGDTSEIGEAHGVSQI